MGRRAGDGSPGIIFANGEGRCKDYFEIAGGPPSKTPVYWTGDFNPDTAPRDQLDRPAPISAGEPIRVLLG